MQPIRKILIANRGEIAVRIIRAVRDMGLSAAVVYSDADADSLAVNLADEAYCIGAAPATESYLNMEKIIQVARFSGADAVHPGYGFLAENALFARRVEKAGLQFIGPPAEAIADMGCKIHSRKRMREAGLPVIPGSLGPIENNDDLLAVARSVGYPLLLKASGGGGGKGMRLAADEHELQEAFERARSETLQSFGTTVIYMEKYIQDPHHIEVQVLADHYGNVVCLGERECSMQRRYQKILEETPSPFIHNKTRKRLLELALQAARTVQYKNAGSVEFIVDHEQNIYFLEMNTRLQVEHGITEMVTGIDLVREQIKIARGEPLEFTQDDIVTNGAALECRIYAEDPDNNFSPHPGTITAYRAPGGGGIRSDTGVLGGFQVPIYYDPLISKVIAWGRNRPEVIQRMKRALHEYHIEGIKTTIPYFRRVMTNAEFLSGNYTTSFTRRSNGYCDKGSSPAAPDCPAVVEPGRRKLCV